MWVSCFLDKFIEDKGMSQEFALVRLWKNWERVMGPSLSKMARPLGKKEKTLIIGVEDGLVMQELSFYSEEFLRRIENFLGWQPFDKVKYKLLEDKTPLTEVKIFIPRNLRERGYGPGPGEAIGGLSLPENSPVTRAYRAYVRLVRENKEQG